MKNRLRKWIDQHPVYERKKARERVAMAADVSESAVRHWANGTRPIPTKKMPAISTVTGIARDDLMQEMWTNLEAETAA